MTSPSPIEAQLQVWDRYALEVISGQIVACKFVRLACKRYIDDLERSKDAAWPFEFDLKRAERVIKFFSRLRLTKGLPHPGKRFIPLPWQQFILANLFGWVHKATGLRRFRKGHVMVARKNGKSHLFAGIGLYGLIADEEMGAEIYSVATKKDQARMIWDAAVEFRRHSPGMSDIVDKSVTSLFVRTSSSKFQALSSDEDGLDGLNVHIGLIDELQNHKTDTVYERIDTGKIARRQPLILSIATAGTSRESVCWREHEYAAHVLQADYNDDTYFGFLAEADSGDDWEAEETWYKANPNLGVPGGISIDDLRVEARAAKNEPAKLNSFLRLHLNIWTQQEYAWMPMDKWRLCVSRVQLKYEETDPVTRQLVEKLRFIDTNKKLEVEDAMLSQWRQPYGGLDLSERHDITSLVLLFPPSALDQLWLTLAYHFVPEACVEKRVKNDRVPYDVWIREGRIIATPGVTIDYDFVKAEVIRLHRKLHMVGLAVDPHNALMLNNSLRGEGVPVVEVQQGWKSLSDPMKELMSWVLSRKLNHLNDPVMNWMAGNVAIWQDAAGNIKPDKAKARERIDGIAAMVNAMHLGLSRSHSVYGSRGIISI